jgi:Zn-dependent protease with chaperone function
MAQGEGELGAAMTESELPIFTPDERESFLESIARHRRGAMRLGWLADACALLLALVVALLMAPLCYAVLGLTLDLVNLAAPMPDLIGPATDAVSGLIDAPNAISPGRYVEIALFAAAPGVCLMLLMMHTLRRLMREAMTNDASIHAARAPNPAELAEQRFANTIMEMAIAASIVAPRVWVTDSDAVNAATFGADAAHANVVISTGLLAGATRAELQGIAGHLVGSIANGDLRIGAWVATLLSLFGLIAKLSQSMADREAARRLLRLLRRSLRSGASVADGRLAMALTNPFDSSTRPAREPAIDNDKIPWRTLAWMPLAGPLVISGFFGGMLCAVMLGPLLALGWRRRKYLADAIAVQLTRDPDTLGNALERIRGAAMGGAFGAWIAHLSVVPSPLIGAQSILGGSSVPMAPSLARRLKALGVMGAQVSLHTGRVIPAWAWLLLAPVIALLVALTAAVVFGLIYVSAALSGLFTWLPAVILHALLR